jgi:AbrB family looped-hinge helix DNA binding protein
MTRTKLSSKGQIILPKSIRVARNWKEGTEFVVEETRGGVILRTIPPFQPSRLEEVIGCVGYRGAAKSLQEIEDAIATGARRHNDRGRH